MDPAQSRVRQGVKWVGRGVGHTKFGATLLTAMAIFVDRRPMDREGAPVLVVEDDPMMRDALKSMLESGGYATVAVRSANEALNYLSTGVPPCLILLDLTLPDIQGDRFYATIRADPVLATTPVVILTGQAEPPRLPGVVATLFKGAPPDALLATIDGACGRAPARSSA